MAGQIDHYLVRGSSCARVHLIGPWLFNCLSTILMLIKHKPTVVAGPGAGVSVSPELVIKEGAGGNKEANGGAEEANGRAEAAGGEVYQLRQLEGWNNKKNIPWIARVRFFIQVTSSATDSASIAEVVSVRSFISRNQEEMLLEG